MSDGMYEAFAKRNQKKEHQINKHVEMVEYGDRVLITNKLEKTSIALKKRTLKKIMKELGL